MRVFAEVLLHTIVCSKRAFCAFSAIPSFQTQLAAAAAGASCRRCLHNIIDAPKLLHTE